jgi:hypothetical protein
MFERRAPLAAQLDKEFWRYFRASGRCSRDTPRLWGAMLPLLLGLVGGWWLARRERNSFFYTGSFLGLTTAGMIVFLNFTDHEVRERDYFFQSGYHAYALWIGAGVAFAILWIRDSFSSPSTRRIAAYSTATLLAFQPVLLLRTLWFTHDESRNYIAHDYAYNMLAPLAPGSYVYTNGDNDTFPLWYMQQVEDFRKDVRVVNLSLLNTDWYIRSCGTRSRRSRSRSTTRDRRARARLVQDSAGSVIYTNEFMVQHITDETARPTAGRSSRTSRSPCPSTWARALLHARGPGLPREPRHARGTVDEPATRKALYQTFKYRGLFRPTARGTRRSTRTRTPRRCPATTRRRTSSSRSTTAAAASSTRRSPRWSACHACSRTTWKCRFRWAASTWTRATRPRRWRCSSGSRSPPPAILKARYYHGVLLVGRGELEAGVKELDAAIQLDPDYNLAYYAAYSLLWEHGLYERSLGYLEKWLQLHPNDSGARALLDKGRGSPGNAPKPPPPPRMPGLP